ncbi:MAG TPA: NnrS family protein [Stellaceae bacterium]|nr:NnrS family protein [Stellaceae bacterium]
MAIVGTRGTASRAEIALSARGPHVFFVFAALFGAFVLAEWVVTVRLGWVNAVPPVMWHAHEMVYGFAAAGLAGIISAWVPEWSGARRCEPARLYLLVGIWLLGRVVMALSALLPAWLVTVVDLSFLPVLAALVITPHLAIRPERNLPLLALVALLWLGNLAMHAETFGGTYALAERGARIGIDAYLLMIAIVGGNAIPVATNGLFADRGLRLKIRSMPILDGLAIATVLVYLISDGLTGTSHATSTAALAAGVFNAVRLVRWHGYRSLRAPAVAILHLGYLWLVVGLLLEAAVPVTNGVADMAAIHALTAGAIGTLLLAAIAHESMVHGGSSARAERPVFAAYGLVSIAVIFRIAALFVPDAFVNLIIISGALWSLGFFCLLASYVMPSLAGSGGHRSRDQHRTSL